MQTIRRHTYFKIRGQLGTYAKMIYVILTQAYSGKAYNVKDNPTEIVFPWIGDENRLFPDERTLFDTEEELYQLNLETKDSHNNNTSKKDFVIVHNTPLEEAACVYRAQQLRQNSFNYNYHYKKMMGIKCYLSYDAYKFYRDNPMWLLSSYTTFMEKRAVPKQFNTASLPFHNLDWIIENHQQVTKKFINGPEWQKGMHSHAQEILLDDIRTVEGFEDTFKINMSDEYKQKWEYLQKYGQIIEQSFVDFHKDRSYN